MIIAIDESPLVNMSLLKHRVRGTGFYIENLKRALLKYSSVNKYIFFTRDKKISKQADVVHYPYFEPFFLTLPIIKQAKRVVTVHDLTPLVFPENFPVGIRGRVKWEIQKQLLKNADAVITDSISSKNDISKFVGIDQKKITVIYLAASEEFSSKKLDASQKEILRKKYSLPKKFALYVGDVTWNKNLPRLLEAIKRIDIPLIMVGRALLDKKIDRTNPWNQDVIKVHELAEENKQIFTLGFVSMEDLSSLYKTATVFTMPSLYEGFGLPILEAMTCGCPVVTSKKGSLVEVGGDAAAFVDPYDVDAMANEIKKIFDSESYQKRLAGEGHRQAKKFSWKKTATETTQVYEKTN